MKYNWRPTRPAFLDFETQSYSPLTTTHKYATHESTRVLTCVVKVDGEMLKFGPYLDSGAKERLAKIAETHTIVAHNAPFDSSIWEDCAGLSDAEWFDTLPCCRAAGMPGKLDAASKIVTGRGKDPMGRRLIDMLCILKPGKAVPAVGPAHQLLLDYNVRDVEELEAVYERVKDFVEPAVMDADYSINRRGVPVDLDFLHRLKGLYEANQGRSLDIFSQMTGGCNPNSPPQVKAWMLSMGFDVSTVSKYALKDFLANPEKYYVGDSELDSVFEQVVDMLETRREVVRVGKGKVQKGIESAESDGRIREQFVYWGAHTGRWSGRGLQLHNIPSAISKAVDTRNIEPTMEAVTEAARRATEETGVKVYVADVLNVMIRRMVKADNLLVADYGAVEARGVAWIANEQRMLQLFSDPSQSVYLDMGEKVFGRRLSKKGDPLEYILSKTLVLGCGYGMSGAKFDWTCRLRSIATANVKAKDAVKVYRESYPAIPAVWRALHEAVHHAVKGLPMECAKSKLYMVGPDLHVELPSGRAIVYRNARIEPRVPAYVKLYGMPEVPVDTVIFDNHRGGTGFLYGSKLCENIVQGLCRDVMADTLVYADANGMEPIFHVHDEVGCDCEDERLEEFLTVMGTPPKWAPGFPLLVEGYSGPQWTKKPMGYRELNCIAGRLFK